MERILTLHTPPQQMQARECLNKEEMPKQHIKRERSNIKG